MQKVDEIQAAWNGEDTRCFITGVYLIPEKIQLYEHNDCKVHNMPDLSRYHISVNNNDDDNNNIKTDLNISD